MEPFILKYSESLVRAGNVVTRDIVAGTARPGVVVADRWGEVVYVAAGSDVADLPDAAKILEWVTYLQRQCPECEGEAK